MTTPPQPPQQRVVRIIHQSRGKTPGFLKSKPGNYTPALVAEFILALIIVISDTISHTARTSYQEAMTKAALQSTALTGVFFILFLISAGKRGSKIAALFGVLIDLGVLFTAVNKGSISDLASLVQGKGLPQTAILLSQPKADEHYSTQDNWQDQPLSGGTQLE